MRSASSQPPASAAALRWLEGAFAGLRAELQSLRGHLNQQQATMAELVSGITQQQALLSELLDARDADFRLAEAAEALPQFVSDAVAHEARVNRERTVAAIASTLDTKLADAHLGEDGGARRAEETAAELRAFLENDQATGSIVAAISTQAATQAMRAEVAQQLPAALDQALAGSDARIDELSQRMEKLVGRALRSGTRAPTKAKAGGTRSPSRTTAAKAAKAAGPAASATTSRAKRAAKATAGSAPPASKGSGASRTATSKAAGTKTAGTKRAGTKAAGTKTSRATKATTTNASAKASRAPATTRAATTGANATSARSRAAANGSTPRARRAPAKAAR
jgi:hypothetical protein